MQTNHTQYLLFLHTCYFMRLYVICYIIAMSSMWKTGRLVCESETLFFILFYNFWLLTLRARVIRNSVNLLLSVWCTTIRKCVFRFYICSSKSVILTCVFAAPPSSSHPPFPLLNKPSSSSSSHSATFYLCCTWEMRGGWERRWMKWGVENEKECVCGVGGARLGKMPFDWI